MNSAHRTDSIRVEKGQASEEELAALTAVLLARAAHRPADVAGPAARHGCAVASPGASERLPRGDQLAAVSLR